MTVNDDHDWSTRTFGNEDRLPRVPLPTLESSCARFLEWCAPLLDADQTARTEQAVAEYLRPDSPARELHAELRRFDAAEGTHSWLDRFWPSRYLGRRDRIALNANFFFLFQDSELTQVQRAAGLIAGAVAHKRAVDAEELPPVVQRGAASSMEQHKYLFSTIRIPGEQQDTVRSPYSAEHPGPSDARHVVVFFRGNAFRLDVLAADGTPHDLADLATGLEAIRDAGSQRAPVETAVGHLTTKARADWAHTRQRLLELGNGDALETIESALFCLCLEDFAPTDVQEACDQLLHGDSGNRWFDKAVSLVVFEDGRAGINVEHCELDGTTILAFVDGLLDSTPEQHAANAGARALGVPDFSRLDFVLDDALRAEVRDAAGAFATFAAGTSNKVLAFEDFGSERAKRLGMSPDAFVQLAYQLAHHRTKGIGATYESIATRQWRHGRTEAMRVVTPQVVDFVRTVDDPDADAAAKTAAFRAAAEAHVARAKQCQAGDAPEQHLWELQLIQRRGGEADAAPLALYDSPGWTIMRDDYLSTSSAPSKNIQHFGFGSTSGKCIGVAYVLLPDRLNIYLSTPLAVSGEMYKFADHLRNALQELEDLLITE
ncbi:MULTISPECIES: choline/carnitine O-acyltransferase [unclassified Saccharopolyspora]|uniref:choline/carnitine O-acyltransferase n=1 Tax=unclassified Saccharopolyspora TaxID=2646250 RepID=UPI001CD433D7|nr:MULTISPECIES: choline/carnitine O-acyltransferase [unclassified Saccharopolyspora]MCA1184831.1 choline/carnitine O-acyltransferase [Saccharopolyspora sp. 6T]MCA1226425.1 choline/carnitine O-acyltransferase [Saccharopolyspora sp. 6M]MCA1280868.1 choline/carnitine O-acyltransferase [Saccharopolyspora sp. 7B]